MGVTNLWQVLEPVQVHQTLSSLKGQTLAVDLSIWVCETQCVKQMQGVVSKPYLRNLFFRISHLLQLGVHLVFVIEGRAPELKQQVMAKRQETRFPQRKAVGGQRRGGRRNFNACLKECCEMLDYLGVPYVQSPGEAEATCAALNASRVVDACLTNDGDAFLYGARTVYRNFTMNTKDPHVECYSMKDVEERLGLSREKLVAMALLLGCDYLPKGVPGVGVERAIKLMNALPSSNVLERFETWSSMPESCCVDAVEVYIRRKALLVQDFPQKEVIQEFLQEKKKTPRHISKWCRPSMSNLQVFCMNKLEWPVEYTVEKILPLITLWDMSDLTSSTPQTDRHLVPKQIVKSRVRHGVACYEILWNQPETDSGVSGDVYRTIEEQVLFRNSYPQIVAEFDTEQENKKVKTKRKSRKKKNTEKENGTEETEISVRLASVNVKEEVDVEFNDVGDDIDTEDCDKAKQIPSESKPDGCVLNVQLRQQMKASPMHSLELALRSLPRRSEKDGHVAVERSLNFSSSEENEEEKEEEYLPLSQRLQLKIAKPRGHQRRVPQSRGSSTNNQGGEGIDVMVRAISQGVSGALRGCFSSDSDSDDLQTFSSQTGIQLDSSVTGYEHTSKQTSSEKHQSSPSENGLIGLQKTPIWERRMAKSTEAINKGDYFDVPDINFSVLTPDVLGRSMPSVRIRSGASSSTPEGQHVDSMSKFSYNLSNLSPHLSENAMVSPFLRPEALHSPIIMTSCEKLQTYQSFSTLWENTSMNKTNGAIEFGDFEVQTSLLNSFNKLNITHQEKTSVLSDVCKKVFDSPSEIKGFNFGENIFDSPSENKEICSGQSKNFLEEDSVIIISSTSDLSFSGQKVKASEKPKESVCPSPLRSVLGTVNRQKDRQNITRSNKERTRDLCQSSPVCVGKENEVGVQLEGEDCSRHSPLSLIDRLRQRLGNQTDSGLISNFNPFSVKPVKPVK